MKKLLCLLLLLVASSLWAVNVELSINTSNFLLEQGQIVNPNTLEIKEVTTPITVYATKNKLYYNTNEGVKTSDSFMIMANDLIKFQANHKEYIYKGNIKIFAKDKKITFINTVDLEDYVEGVLRGEYISFAPLEACKAQAICIRTYTLNRMKKNNYHLCDGVHCQHYVGYNDIPSFKLAAKETAGYVIKYKGSLIHAMYYSHCGGLTNSWNGSHNSNDFPYLASVKDDFHKDLKEWTFKVSLSDVEKKLKFYNIKKVEIISKKYNRVWELKFINDKGSKVIKGEDFRFLLLTTKLKSTMFTCEMKDGFIIFTGKGYGHGYGLCQYGAMEMAKQGYNTREILKFYYKGCDIVKE